MIILDHASFWTHSPVQFQAKGFIPAGTFSQTSAGAAGKFYQFPMDERISDLFSCLMEIFPECFSGDTKYLSSFFLVMIFEIYQPEDLYLIRMEYDPLGFVLDLTLGCEAPKRTASNRSSSHPWSPPPWGIYFNISWINHHD